MTSDQIHAFRTDWLIAKMAEDWCHVYLWITDAHLGHGYPLLEAWGCVPKTTLVWIKDRIGMGNYFRHQHELCLFAVKGKQRLKRSDVPTIFHAKNTGHSRKLMRSMGSLNRVQTVPTWMCLPDRHARDGTCSGMKSIRPRRMLHALNMSPMQRSKGHLERLGSRVAIVEKIHHCYFRLSCLRDSYFAIKSIMASFVSSLTLRSKSTERCFNAWTISRSIRTASNLRADGWGLAGMCPCIPRATLIRN